MSNVTDDHNPNIKTLELRFGVDEVWTDDFIIDALKAYKGLVTHTATAMGCSSAVIFDRINRSPKVKEALDLIREERIDKAEGGLDNALRREEPWAIALVLKTIGKGRGYVERSEHTGKDGADLFSTDHIMVIEHGVVMANDETSVDGDVQEVPELVDGKTIEDERSSN